MKKKIIGIDASRYGLKQPTGVEHYTNRLIDGLLKKMLGTVKIRLYVAHEWQKQELNRFVCDDIEVKHIVCSRFWTQMGLTREMKQNPPDVLFVPSHVLPRALPEKSIVVIHGLEATRFPRSYSMLVRLYQRWTTDFAVKRAKRLIAVSQSVKDDLIRFYHCKSEKIDVVYEGVDSLLEFNGDFSLPFSAQHPFIFAVGRIEERKNQLRLLKAFSRFWRYHPTFHLVLAGQDGYGAQRTHDYYQKLESDIKKHIHFLGYVSHEKIFEYMKRARIFAYPSLAEGFGLPLLEAMQCGVPILTSNATACAEIGGAAALVVNTLDVKDIVDGLTRLATDENFAKKLVERGFERVKQFNWDRCVSEIANVLFSI